MSDGRKEFLGGQFFVLARLKRQEAVPCCGVCYAATMSKRKRRTRPPNPGEPCSWCGSQDRKGG